MKTDFVVSKDRPEVTHIPTGMIWKFHENYSGSWDGQVTNWDKIPALPAVGLAKLNRLAGEAFVREWKL